MTAGEATLKGVRLSEEDVAAVLQRAAQYDGSVSVDELSSVASEAGISEAAVVKAVMEMLEERGHVAPPAEVVVESPPSDEDRGSWHSILYGVTGGAAAGVVASLGDGALMLGVGSLLVGSAFRAFDNRRNGSHRRFQLEAASCAAGFALATGGMIGLTEDMSFMIGSYWMAVSASGSAIISTARTRTIGAFVQARTSARRLLAG